MAEEFTLELENESTFNKNYPKLSQKQLELKYRDLWIKTLEEGTAKGLSRRVIWEAFTGAKPNPEVITQGVLLASDVPASYPKKKGIKSEWGDGKPYFKVRFTDNNDITVSAAVSQQVRKWRTKFLTDGSPGTPLRLEDTGKQFYHPISGHALQIHHEKGISEKGPFIDATIKKLLPGTSKVLRNLGQKEYKTFKNWAHKTGRIFGDKVELFTGLIRDQHINKPGSAHINRSKVGSFYSTQASGASALGKDHGVDIKGEQIPIRKPQELLNKADRLNFNIKHDPTQRGSIWDEMGVEDDLYYPSSKDATTLARQTGNVNRDKTGEIIPKKAIPSSVRQERIDTEDYKKTLPVIKKMTEAYQNAGMEFQKAFARARTEYDRIRLGEWSTRGIDTKKYGASLLGSAVLTAMKVPKAVASVLVDPRDLLHPDITTNIAQAQNRIDAGEDPWTVWKEEGLESAGVVKDEFLKAGGLIAGLKIASKIPKAGTIVKGGTAVLGAPVAMKGLLAGAVYGGVNAYLKERTGRSLNERVIMDTGYANLLKTDRVVRQEVGDDGVSREVVTYEKDPEVEEDKWNDLKTYFENRNK